MIWSVVTCRKLRFFFLLLVEGILSHIQYLAFVTSKCPTPLDCVALPSPFANPLSGYRGNIHFQQKPTLVRASLSSL